MSDVAQFPTPTMATRTEPIRLPSFPVFRSLRDRPGAARDGLRVVGGLRLPVDPFVVDELGQPAHLVLDRLQPVALELERVAVEPLARAGERAAHAVEALLQPTAATLEDAQPVLRADRAEEREVD